MTRMAPRKFKRKRARVSLTLRLICGYLVRSLLPFLTCIYETLLDVEMYNLYRICVQLCHGRVSIFLCTRPYQLFCRYGRASFFPCTAVPRFFPVRPCNLFSY